MSAVEVSTWPDQFTANRRLLQIKSCRVNCQYQAWISEYVCRWPTT